MKINNYKYFLLEKDNEKSEVKKTKDWGERTGAKVKRIVTGDHVGFDPKEGAKYPLTFLPEKKFNRIVDLWKSGNKKGAAEYLRGLIIGERDTQFKVAAALIMVGAAMVKAGVDPLPEPEVTPDVTPVPEGELASDAIQSGEGLTQAMNRAGDAGLGPDSTVKDLVDFLKSSGNGDVSQGIKGWASGGDKVAEVTKAFQEMASNTDLHSQSLGKLLQGEWSGTGKTLGDILHTTTGNEFSFYK